LEIDMPSPATIRRATLSADLPRIMTEARTLRAQTLARLARAARDRLRPTARPAARLELRQPA
jgi:hypothetical protein